MEHRRRLAVQRVFEGYSTVEIAESLGVDPSTVRRWVASFRDQGEQGLTARPVPGRPRKLTPTPEKIIRRWLDESPTVHGFETELWTAPRLGHLIQDELAVQLHPKYLSAWLRARRLTPEAAARPPRTRPEGDRRVAGVRRAAPPTKARRQNAHLALIDERGLLMAPLTRRTWTPRGPTPELMQKSGPRAKVAVAAAVWLSPRRDRLGLDFKTRPNGSFESWHGAAVLEAMLREMPGRFVVLWDGGPRHKGDPIRDLVEHFSARLSLERLPPYAPMLNPIEVLWSWLKGERLSTFGPRDAHEIDGRVLAELRAIHEDQALLRNLFHASDLPIPRALLF